MNRDAEILKGTLEHEAGWRFDWRWFLLGFIGTLLLAALLCGGLV